MIEIEVKALLSQSNRFKDSPYAALSAICFDLNLGLSLVAKSEQLNHYFKSKHLPDSHMAFAELRSQYGIDASPSSSIRTRFEKKTGQSLVYLVVKSKLHGDQRLETELVVDKTIEALDLELSEWGFDVESKWSRNRVEYDLALTNGYKVKAFIDQNSGYGYVLELEIILPDKASDQDLFNAQMSLNVLLQDFNLKPFDGNLIEQMYKVYCNSWEQYYGTNETIPLLKPHESIDNTYLNIVQEIQDLGIKKPVFGKPDLFRVGIQGVSFVHDLSKSFPALTSKKVAYKKAIQEMLWFIEGTGDARSLIKARLGIWDSWAEKYFGRKDWKQAILDRSISSIMPIHYANGSNWRGTGLDQFQWVIDQLPRNPSRNSYVVSFWNPEQVYHMAEATGNEPVLLPACHFTHQLLTRENEALSQELGSTCYYLDIHVIMRSWDFPAGAPFNIAQYAALVHMYCTAMNNGKTAIENFIKFVPGNLHFYGTDVHFYSDQLEAINTQLDAETSLIPAVFKVRNRDQKSLKDFTIEDFALGNYFPSERIFVPVATVGGMN